MVFAGSVIDPGFNPGFWFQPRVFGFQPEVFSFNLGFLKISYYYNCFNSLNNSQLLSPCPIHIPVSLFMLSGPQKTENYSFQIH
jgi:hypothetical protein